MNTRKTDAAVVLVVALVLAAGYAPAEIIDVYPSQEALVTIDENGFPVDFQPVAGVGDSVDGRHLRALITFDLSFLPPGASISSAVIHTRVDAVYGDPASLGPLMAARVAETRGQPSVDIQATWGMLTEFIAPVPVTGTIAAGSDLTADLTAQFQGSFPSPEWNLDPGRAVIRFQFSDQNNGSGIDDFFYFHRTRLELDVELPNPITERPVGRHLKYCIPVAASLPGAAGTRWTTEMHISARHDSSVWLYFTETETDGAAEFQVQRVDLGMWETVGYDDVLPDLFGVEETKGWIEVFSTDPEIAINARVANVGGEGSYGQTVPVIDESKMLRLSEIRFGDAYRRLANLIMMDAENRTNIGLVNLGPDDVTVDLIAIPPYGAFSGSTTVALGGFEHRQIDRLETVIPETAGAGLISLSFGIHEDAAPVYRQGVAVYVSRVDNTTGDAVFILP